MQMDGNGLARLLSMSDEELAAVIASAAKERGLSLPAISGGDIARIRATLGSMSGETAENILKNTKGGK